MRNMVCADALPYLVGALTDEDQEVRYDAMMGIAAFAEVSGDHDNMAPDWDAFALNESMRVSILTTGAHGQHHTEVLRAEVVIRTSIPRAAVVTLSLAIATGCACSVRDTRRESESVSNTVPRSELGMIPRANPALYEGLESVADWKNPVIRVRADQISVTWKASSRIVATSEELEAALESIPASYWPYGRVVAYSEASIGSGGDEANVNEKRDLVVDTVRRLQVTLEVWPTA